MSDSTSLPTARVAAALVHAQTEARAVERDGKNQNFGYRFASAESMIQEGRTALGVAKLALVQGGTRMHVLEAKLEQGKEYSRVLLEVEYVLVHESGEELRWSRTFPCVESNGRPIDKAVGAALTSGLKFAIRDLLLLPRDDEQADMDRRNDSDDRKGSGREERGEPARERDTKPANDAQPEAKKSEERPHPFRHLMPIIRERKLSKDELVTEIDRANLRPDEREAIEILVQVYAAKDPKTITSLGAQIRKADFDDRLRKWTLDQIRPAWDELTAPPADKGAA